ncbi:hypothetical protein [Thioalkalivibrio sp.]|uniref:hypothetical protein n=1 Tax=Thioalkalivibrio sp. TaxID=2093813 RepID=UPI0012D6AB5E|nr:hypothetical protein [Thioalkalivibrio sp.]TVP81217.1 MAG: hypothetical protein EA346_05715 [Thioalkalivibrio sp.]
MNAAIGTEPSPPVILFIPVSGPQGAGEYYRALTIAQACRSRHPKWGLHICVSHDADVEKPGGLGYHTLRDSPTRDTDGIERILRELRPDLVIFDSTLRQRQLKLCRQLGVTKVIYISSRASSRRRGFGLRKLRTLDEHWMITLPAEQHLTSRERLLARINSRLQIRFFSTLLPPDTPERELESVDRAGLPREGHVLFVSGGGGGMVNGEPIDRTFQQAARRFHAATGHPTLLVAGPLSSVPLESGHLRLELRSMSPGDLATMIGRAALVVSGGGSLVQQTLAQGRPLLAVPAGGSDQPARLAKLAREGVLQTCVTTPEAMASRAAVLLQDRQAQRRLIARARGLGFRNDMPQVVSVMRQLLAIDDLKRGSL